MSDSFPRLSIKTAISLCSFPGLTLRGKHLQLLYPFLPTICFFIFHSMCTVLFLNLSHVTKWKMNADLFTCLFFSHICFASFQTSNIVQFNSSMGPLLSCSYPDCQSSGLFHSCHPGDVGYPSSCWLFSTHVGFHVSWIPASCTFMTHLTLVYHIFLQQFFMKHFIGNNVDYVGKKRLEVWLRILGERWASLRIWKGSFALRGPDEHRYYVKGKISLVYGMQDTKSEKVIDEAMLE